MKKITIALFVTAMLTSTLSVAANPAHKGHMTAKTFNKEVMLKHGNPMPNLMSVAKKFSHELDLNDEQAAKLKKWSNHNGSIMKNMLMELMNAEQALHSTALSDVSQNDVQEKLDNVMKVRLKIATGKMKCRTNMRRILNDNQWSKVVDVYKNKIM